MAAKNRPYEQFGAYILFKKLEADALGDLWRAGRIEGGQLGATVAVRRLTGGNRAALTESASGARGLVPLLTGTTFAKDQTIDVAGGVPFVAHDYSGGRSLRTIIDRSRGGQGAPPSPLPIDQAMIIAEKVVLSLSTTADLRYLGNRLCHGALIPQFIWISDDGEIRVAGQQLGTGIAASLADPKVAAEIGRYFPPEYAAGEATKTTDVYSMGAIFYLLVTGSEPPDATTSSAFTQAVRAAKTPLGQPLPDDLRAIVEKSLALDPAARYASVADMKQALSAVAHSGKYSATTFNLAFYLSNLLKKEMEGEALDREKEAKVNVAPYLETPPAAPAAAPIAATAGGDAPRKSRKALLVVAASAVLAIGAGLFVVFNKGAAKASPKVVAAQPAPHPPLVASAISQPVVSTPSTGTALTATTTSVDPSAEKKAFEAAVNQKMQEEMLKLQHDFNKTQQQASAQRTPPTPVLGRQQPASQPDERTPSAAALDQNRLTTTRPETPTAPLPQVQPASSALTPQTASQAPAAEPQPSGTAREGDIVEFTELDKPVVPLSQIRVTYPPMAQSQRITTSVIVTTLIDEDGRVAEVKVLKGDGRFGFNEAAIRAMRATRFTPPTKGGVRVKTRRPQSILFTP
jgi:serine/threonine-protein kinase